MSPGRAPMNLRVDEEGQGSERPSATNSRTIVALAHLKRLVAHEQRSVRLMFRPSILRTRRRGEHGSDLTLASSARECYRILLFARDVTFDARFLHFNHVASEQAHVPVNRIDGAVCADSVLVTAWQLFLV